MKGRAGVGRAGASPCSAEPPSSIQHAAQRQRRQAPGPASALLGRRCMLSSPQHATPQQGVWGAWAQMQGLMVRAWVKPQPQASAERRKHDRPGAQWADSRHRPRAHRGGSRHRPGAHKGGSRHRPGAQRGGRGKAGVFSLLHGQVHALGQAAHHARRDGQPHVKEGLQCLRHDLDGLHHRPAGRAGRVAGSARRGEPTSVPPSMVLTRGHELQCTNGRRCSGAQPPAARSGPSWPQVGQPAGATRACCRPHHTGLPQRHQPQPRAWRRRAGPPLHHQPKPTGSHGRAAWTRGSSPLQPGCGPSSRPAC